MSILIGCAASAILLVTLAAQIHKQWARGTTQGVSRLLFIGQFLASVGFTIYSAVIGSTLFVVVNALLAANAVIGAVLWFVQRSRERRSRAAPSRNPPTAGTLVADRHGWSPQPRSRSRPL